MPEAGFELTIFLPQPPQCWDDKLLLLHPTMLQFYAAYQYHPIKIQLRVKYEPSLIFLAATFNKKETLNLIKIFYF